MDALEPVLEVVFKGARALEEAVRILQRSQTPDEARRAFTQVAALFRDDSDQTLTNRLREASRPGWLDDSQVLQFRQFMIGDFPKQASKLRETAADLRAKFG